MTTQSDLFPWPDDQIARYTAYRMPAPPTIDGQLDEAAWRAAPRSPRFVDLMRGTRPIHSTHAAVLWDETNLYVGYWIEEPMVTATLTERDALIYTDNDVELFIAGQDAYYELEINAFGTIYEVFFIWEEAYAAYADRPEFRRDVPGAQRFDGVGFKHPRQRIPLAGPGARMARGISISRNVFPISRFRMRQ